VYSSGATRARNPSIRKQFGRRISIDSEMILAARMHMREREALLSA
jgi:hypothetical protein